MDVRSITVGPFMVSCHFVSEDGCGPALVIDPGAHPERLMAFVREHGYDVRLIVNTHGHGDHIGCNAALKRAFPGAELAIHEADAPLLADPHLNLSAFFGFSASSPPADQLLKDGHDVALGNLTFEVIHVPGHSPGGICLGRRAADGDPPVLFTGDCLFAGGIGRSDFPGGDGAALLKGIRDRLLTWPDETLVYPGHGPPTTIGRERRANPYLR